MRMNDYEYEFKKDSAEKKNVARSARSTRTHCGKRGAVKFPSDYMTKKELNAMNGECISYASLKKPMSFEEFKKLPKDLRKAYLEYIDTQFDSPPYTEIGKMLNVAGNTLSLYAVECGIIKGKGKINRKWKRDEFYAWMSGADMDAPVAPVESEPVDILPEEINKEMEVVEVVEPETPKAFEIVSDTEPSVIHEAAIVPNTTVPEIAVPVSGTMTFESNANIALDTMKMLLINKKVKMTIQWELVND